LLLLLLLLHLHAHGPPWLLLLPAEHGALAAWHLLHALRRAATLLPQLWLLWLLLRLERIARLLLPRHAHRVRGGRGHLSRAPYTAHHCVASHLRRPLLPRLLPWLHGRRLATGAPGGGQGQPEGLQDAGAGVFEALERRLAAVAVAPHLRGSGGEAPVVGGGL
jgi:hypothetical protein